MKCPNDCATCDENGDCTNFCTSDDCGYCIENDNKCIYCETDSLLLTDEAICITPNEITSGKYYDN